MGEDPWLASQERRSGDDWWGRVQATIETASACALVVSPNALKERDLARELRLALEVQKRRQEDGKDHSPVIAIALDGIPLGALE